MYQERLPIRYLAHDYGFVLILNKAVNLDNYNWSQIPNLKPILDYCKKKKITYVDFDRDVEMINEFPIFDW